MYDDPGGVDDPAQCRGERRQRVDRVVRHVRRRDLAGPAPVEGRRHHLLDEVPAESPGRFLQARVGEHGVGAGRGTARIRHSDLLTDNGPLTAQGTAQRLAEADGNRTRLTEMLGHYGFEDRARHQTRYASADHSRRRLSITSVEEMFLHPALALRA